MMTLPLRALLSLALLASSAVSQGALAQSAPVQGAPVQSAPPAETPAVSLPAAAPLSLAAYLAGTPQPIGSGLVWRIFEERGGDTQPILLTKSTEATPTFPLQPGSYIVHVAYGFVSVSKRVVVPVSGATERLALSAGALKLAGAIGEQVVPAARVSFAIYVPVGTNSEGRLIRGNVKAGEVVRLPEGTYHVVSTYGDSNAIMRADLKVDLNKVTEATLNHRAATVTLKLVGAAGGEAFAGTAFSVLTPGGDVIREAIGAFPSVTLAEGEYVLIARHDGQVFTREFKVESGLDRDIEVLAKK